VCQRDNVFVSIAVLVQKVRKESEDLRRDPVDGCDGVLPRPNQLEDLESVLLENVELKKYKNQLKSTNPFCSFI